MAGYIPSTDEGKMVFLLDTKLHSCHYPHFSAQDIVSRYQRMYLESQRDLIT